MSNRSEKLKRGGEGPGKKGSPKVTERYVPGVAVAARLKREEHDESVDGDRFCKIVEKESSFLKEVTFLFGRYVDKGVVKEVLDAKEAQDDLDNPDGPFTPVFYKEVSNVLKTNLSVAMEKIDLCDRKERDKFQMKFEAYMNSFFEYMQLMATFEQSQSGLKDSSFPIGFTVKRMGEYVENTSFEGGDILLPFDNAEANWGEYRILKRDSTDISVGHPDNRDCYRNTEKVSKLLFEKIGSDVLMDPKIGAMVAEEIRRVNEDTPLVASDYLHLISQFALQKEVFEENTRNKADIPAARKLIVQKMRQEALKLVK